ncbi:unnamed protein product, partial [Leptidea sinapis]
MFGIRTPPKNDKLSPKAGTSTNVRRSIGKWEGTNIVTSDETAHPIDAADNSQRQTVQHTVAQKDTQGGLDHPGISPSLSKSGDRVAQARIWVQRAKTYVNQSRNLKSDLKQGILTAVDNLYRLVKESTAAKKGIAETILQPAPPIEDSDLKQGIITAIDNLYLLLKETALVKSGAAGTSSPLVPPPIPETSIAEKIVTTLLSAHSELITKSMAQIEELKEELADHQAALSRTTYASVVAGGKKEKLQTPVRMHS